MGFFQKPVSGLRVAVKLSYDAWVKNHKAYGPLYKTLPKHVTEIAHDALEEIEPLRPEVFQWWWAKNHDRYIRTSKQRELLLFYEIFYYFLCSYIRGEFKRDYEPGSERPKEKTKAKAAP